MNKKVLVGCPTSGYHEYCLDDYYTSITSFSYKNYDTLLVDNSKNDSYFNKLKKLNLNVIKDEFKEKARDRVINSRNILRDYALKNNYDYLLSLEQDIIPPKNIIEKMLSSKKDIISGIYFKPLKDKFVPLVSKKIDKKTFEILKNSQDPFVIKKIKENKITSYDQVGQWMTAEEVEEPRIIEIHEAGLGCVLISRKVLEKIRFRYNPELEGFDDTWFYHDARIYGFKAFADTSIKCKHLIKDRPLKLSDLEK